MKEMLDVHKLDMIAICESQRNDDHPVVEMHEDYIWLGKNRKDGMGGGVGFLCNKKSISVNDDNLLESKVDDYERYWISVKVNRLTIAIGVTYFPVDNKSDKFESAQKLQQELVENIADLQNKFDKVILLGDFNGKIAEFRIPGKVSSNGTLLENLAESTDMVILNVDTKCTGETTWQRGPLKSVIDYVLCPQNMYNYIEYLCIDEEQNFSVGSDHNFLILKAHLPLDSEVTTAKKEEKEKINKWNINNDTNWSAFTSKINECFASWNPSDFNNVDEMWTDFKSRLLNAGTKSIGYKSFNGKRDYWNKEISKLIHNRKLANKMYRQWSQCPNSSPELLSMLREDYMDKR